MVDLRREEAGQGPVIRGFEGGAYRVGDRIVPGGLVLTPDNALDWVLDAAITGAGMLDIAMLAPALTLDPLPEFLLLGTGARLVQPPLALRQSLEAQGIGLEVMDSRTAARTWGMLRVEARWITAALLPLNA